MARKAPTVNLLRELGITATWAGEGAVLYGLPLACFVVGAFSGLRLPNIWSMTHYLFDYHFGFAKRALFGAALSFLFSGPISYWTLAGIAAAIFLLIVFLLWRLYLRLIAIDPDFYLVQILLFTSMGFVFLCHEIGYYDQIGVIVAAVCLLLPATLPALLLRLALVALALLIHEAFFLLFLPVVLLDVYFKGADGQGWAAWTKPVALGGCAAVLVVLITVLGPFDVDRREEFVAHLAAKAADFTIRKDAVWINFRGLSENLASNLPLWRNPGRSLALVFSILVAAPLTAFFLARTIDLSRRLQNRRRLDRWLIIAAGLAPLTLLAIAWDLHRFIALTQITAYLALASVVIAGGDKLDAGVVRRDGLPLFCVLLLFSLWSEITLFNGYAVRKFPDLFTQPLFVAREVLIDRTRTIGDLIPRE